MSLTHDLSLDLIVRIGKFRVLKVVNEGHGVSRCSHLVGIHIRLLLRLISRDDIRVLLEIVLVPGSLVVKV